jgi:hypothetical protein
MANSRVKQSTNCLLHCHCNRTTNHCTTEAYNTMVSLYSTYHGWWLCITKHTATVINGELNTNHHARQCYLPQPSATTTASCKPNPTAVMHATTPNNNANEPWHTENRAQMMSIIIWAQCKFFFFICFSFTN